MTKLKKKPSILLACALSFFCFNTLGLNEINAQNNIKANITINKFDAKDQLKQFSEEIKLNEIKEITNINVVSPIKIEFKDSLKNDEILKLSTQSDLKDFISIEKLGDNKNLTDTHFEDVNFDKKEFTSINLKPKTSLNPDLKYVLKIDTSKLNIVQANTSLGKNDYILNMTTEKTPNIVKADNLQIEKKPAYQTINLEFDRHIELVDKNKILLDNNTKLTDIDIKDKLLKINIGADLANSLELREYTINLGADSIRHPNSTNVFAKDIKLNFIVIKDKNPKVTEDEKRRKEELEFYKMSIANVLADEIQSRYQAEYGSNYDFKSFNDYIRNKYSKDNNKSYTGNDYIQLYLIDHGYVDDFIVKYGRNNQDIRANAQDYLNRYGSFAYSDRERYKNPFFSNPFRGSSYKKGYYDYYEKYDYGYKFPELRIGDDNISQANLEREESLKLKEKELILKERGIMVNKNSNFAPTADNSPKIIINSKSRYFTQIDEYGNSRSLDMGMEPINQNGRTFIAVSPIASKLGLWVNYNHKTKLTTLSKPKLTVALSPNSSYININGKSENMGIRPFIKNGKLMMPVHYISRAFGIEDSKISYNENLIIIENY